MDDRERLLGALDGIDFGKRYFALCDADVGAPQETPPADRQAAVLRAAGFDPRYDEREDFFACGVPGERLTVNVLVRYSTIELVFVLAAPSGTVGPTFHSVAKTLRERAEPGWQHTPTFPRVPFGAARPFEATVAEVAAFVRDIRAAVASIAEFR